MNNNNSGKLIIEFFLIVVIGLFSIGFIVIKVDPFFHYHTPQTDKYYYELDNQRSQNIGMLEHFDYDALITGSSMAENFNTSELDRLFGTNSIKVAFSGGLFKETNDAISAGLESNPDLKTVVRCLDLIMLMYEKDTSRIDLGVYPTYLYDHNYFTDVKYVYNRDIIFKRVFPMISASHRDDFVPGITSFDEYANWMGDEKCTFGVNTVLPMGISQGTPGEYEPLEENVREIVLASTLQNLTALPEKYPDVNFYYYFSPYSAAWWGTLIDNGIIYKQVQAEQLVIEELLKYDNIKIYSFNQCTDITTDLNNYKDTIHYAEWINSFILHCMKYDFGRITRDNYEQYLAAELEFYNSYDYESLNSQIDYENDLEAKDLLYSHYPFMEE